MALVCDGMGGMQEGETASGYVVEQLAIWFYEKLIEYLKNGKGKKVIKKSLERKLFQLHGELRDYGRGKHIATGTTLSLLLILDNWYLICQIGDSAIFRFRRKAKRMTATHGNGKNGLYRCIGLGKFQVPDFSWGYIRKNDGFLLASDGFYKTIKSGELDAIYGEYCGKDRAWMDKRMKSTVKRLLWRGEEDNISAIFVW